jgi:hypothetical protein
MRYNWPAAGLAFVHWSTGIVMAGFAWLVGAFECDEGCHGGGDWSVTENAWQWGAIQHLSEGLLVALTLFFIAVLVGWVAVGWLIFTPQLIGATALTVFVVYAGLDPAAAVFVVAAEACGVAALVSRAQRRKAFSGP